MCLNNFVLYTRQDLNPSSLVWVHTVLHIWLRKLLTVFVGESIDMKSNTNFVITNQT
jgi:hypothetical protein